MTEAIKMTELEKVNRRLNLRNELAELKRKKKEAFEKYMIPAKEERAYYNKEIHRVTQALYLEEKRQGIR